MRQLTEAGCEIYPMKWVDADKNEYLRRDYDYVVLLQGIRVDWLFVGTSRRKKDFAQIF